MLSDPMTRDRASVLPRVIGYTALGGYLLWNGYWIFRGRIPPSILLGVFHIPAPTTGMTRSCLSLLEGDLRDFFLWNPFTLPILALFLVSLGVLAWRFLGTRKACLPPYFLKLWIGLLLAAWVAKLAMGPAWW